MSFSDLLGLAIALAVFVLALAVLTWWYRRALTRLTRARNTFDADTGDTPQSDASSANRLVDRGSLRLGQAGIVLLGAGLAAAVNALRIEHFVVAHTASDALNYARQAADMWFWTTTFAGLGIALVAAALLPVLLFRLRR